MEESEKQPKLAPNDPYNNMERQDTRPSFRPQNLPENQNNPTTKAKNRLASAEQSAAANPASTIDGGTDQAKSTEQNQTFSPNFTGKGRPNKEETTGKKKSFLRRRGPMLAIMTMLIGGGGMMAGSQALMPFATANRIMEEFNSIKTVMSKRSDRLLRYQVSSDRYRNPTRKTIFHSEKFNLRSKQITRLKTEGIDFAEVQLNNGRKVKLLVYNDGSGSKQPILTQTDMDSIGKTGGIDVDDLKLKMQDAGFGDAGSFKASAMNIDDAFEIDGFKNGYLKSSKTWKGNFAGWFDNLVLKVFDRLGIDRNRFKKWKAASDLEAGNAKFKEAAKNKTQFDEDGVSGTKKDVGEVDDGNGNMVTEPEVVQDVNNGTAGTHEYTDPTDGSTKTVNINADDSVSGKTRLEDVHTALSSKVVKAAQMGGTVICAAFAAVGAIHAIVAAKQASEILNLISGFLESVQKVQAGDGDGSPMAYYANALTAVPAGDDKKSGMASQGMAALFGSGGIDTNSKSVQNTNSEALLPKLKALGTEVQYTVDTFENCLYVRMVSSAIGLVVDVIGALTGGIATLVKGLVKSIGISMIIGIVLPALLKEIIPWAAEMIMKDYLADFVGEDLGNAIVNGANKYLGGNHQGGGGSPGDANTVKLFYREAQQVIAEEAEYDRQTRSPFDTSSQNTFLGSILYKTIPIASNLTSITSIASGVSSLVGSSLTALLPTASALADTELITTQGDCPILESVGIMGDAYCNPYYITDTTTLNADPGENIYEYVANKNLALYTGDIPSQPRQADPSICRHGDAQSGYYWTYYYPTNFEYIKENNDDPYNCVLDVKLDSSDNPVINLNSALGRYIAFCGQRSSPWGMADAAIASQAAKLDIDTGSGLLDGSLNGVIGAIPVIGDAVDYMQAAEESQNVPWVGGKACVASSTNPDWNENKMYQRYTEDQRWLEAAGMIEESAVVSALNKYYEAHPLDNTYEGYLARMSGLSKEEIIATLDLMDKMTFLAHYNPTDLYPTPAKPKKQISLTNTTQNPTLTNHQTSPIPHHIIYTDTRNRSYAI